MKATTALATNRATTARQTLNLNEGKTTNNNDNNEDII